MTQLGKGMLIVGVVIAIAGAVLWMLGRAGFRGLPGDIRYESGNVKIYVPIVTCLLLSLILTAILWIWRSLSR